MKKRIAIDPSIKCDECHSTNIMRMGFGIRKRKRVQQYRCKDCHKIFVPNKDGLNESANED